MAEVKAEAEQEDDRCPICQRLWTEQDQADWIFLEITRYSPDGRPGWDTEGFCSQSHAAEWLARALPPFEPVTYMPRTLRDRVEDLGLLVLFLIPAVLACVGIFAIGDWLGLYG